MTSACDFSEVSTIHTNGATISSDSRIRTACRTIRPGRGAPPTRPGPDAPDAGAGWTTALSSDIVPPGESPADDREHEQEGEEHHALRARRAHVEALERRFVDLVGHHRGRVRRATLRCEHVELLEHLER